MSHEYEHIIERYSLPSYQEALERGFSNSEYRSLLRDIHQLRSVEECLEKKPEKKK